MNEVEAYTVDCFCRYVPRLLSLGAHAGSCEGRAYRAKVGALLAGLHWRAAHRDRPYSAEMSRLRRLLVKAGEK